MIDSEQFSAVVAAAARKVRQPFNRCRTTSHDLADALVASGIPASVIRCSGLQTYAPDADRRWLKLGPQLYWTHYVVRVEDIVIDLTRRQFVPKAEKVHIQPYAEFAAEWLDIGRDLDWSAKHGLESPTGPEPAARADGDAGPSSPSP